MALPGWARMALLRWAKTELLSLGRSSLPRLGRGFSYADWAGILSQRQCPGWVSSSPSRRGRFFFSRLGRCAQPGPCYCFPGRINPCGPRFTLSGTYSSSGFASSALCQSWDASRLRLAHPPSSYAGLGTLLGSDQHTPPLLVSLILRRRIRLMTWRS
jgi:hypothetical protein